MGYNIISNPTLLAGKIAGKDVLFNRSSNYHTVVKAIRRHFRAYLKTLILPARPIHSLAKNGNGAFPMMNGAYVSNEFFHIGQISWPARNG